MRARPDTTLQEIIRSAVAPLCSNFPAKICFAVHGFATISHLGASSGCWATIKLGLLALQVRHRRTLADLRAHLCHCLPLIEAALLRLLSAVELPNAPVRSIFLSTGKPHQIIILLYARHDASAAGCWLLLEQMSYVIRYVSNATRLEVLVS